MAQKLAPPSDPGEEYFVSPEKLVSGNPRQTLWMQYSDPSGKFFTGIWRSEPGEWRVSYTEEEYCQMIEGVSRITGADGQTITVRAGDSFVIPSGFVGTWEVIDRTTKRFVICEPPT
ncbi:MAG: transcriptional regulator [Burkholderiales bacterium PBB1]|nr:MAG: transcriptional regulator [Burkholderiales bacterium PBB1]